MNLEKVQHYSPEWLRATARELLALAAELEALDAQRMRDSAQADLHENPMSVMASCATMCRVPLDQILSPSRSQHVTYARQVIMYVLYDYVHLSQPHIAVLLKRDSATVHFGIHKIRKRVVREPEYRAYLNKLLAQLGLTEQRHERSIILGTQSETPRPALLAAN